MNIEKIEINGHYVWVDKDAEIKEGDLILTCEKDIITWIDLGNETEHDNKIIAASPELNLEGVPTYVEWLAEQNPEAYRESDYQKIFVEGFIQGYQTRDKELNHLKGGELFTSMADNVLPMQREQPTWDDVRNIIYKSFLLGVERIKYSKELEDEIIEQLKQLKK